MAESTALFRYRSIDAGKREIRVIRLHNTTYVFLHDFTDNYRCFLQPHQTNTPVLTQKWLEHAYKDSHSIHATCNNIHFPRWRLDTDRLELDDFEDTFELDSPVPSPSRPSFGLHAGADTGRKDAEDVIAPKSLKKWLCVPPRFSWGDFEAIS